MKVKSHIRSSLAAFYFGKIADPRQFSYLVDEHAAKGRWLTVSSRSFDRPVCPTPAMVNLMPPKWDVIVVGAGHNGLTAAAYLAQHNYNVLVLERRNEVGGCASTVTALGTRVNICNCDHSMVFESGIIEELSLEDHGLRYLHLDPVKHFRVIEDTGTTRPWWLFKSTEQTLEAVAQCHPGSEAHYKNYLREALPIAKFFLEFTSKPPSFSSALRSSTVCPKTATHLLKLRRLSADQALRNWFPQEALRAPAASSTAVWGTSPLAPGTGLASLGYALGHLAPTARPVGGSGALTNSLAKAISAAGGIVRTGVEVTSIVCDLTGVRKVLLTNGEELPTEAVITTIDPKTTILSLLSSPPTRSVKALTNRWLKAPKRSGYESKIDAVVDRPPDFGEEDRRLSKTLGVHQPSGTTTITTPSTSVIGDAHRQALAGKITSQPIFLSNTPGLLDKTMDPLDVGHTFSLEVLYTPYHLQGGWEKSSEPNRWLEVFSSHTDNEFLSGVRRWRALTPVDYEREFSLDQGYAPSYPGTTLDVILGRKREITRYDTPVKGLYLAGSGTFPGAGIWGASGRNAAWRVMEHFHKKRMER